MKYDSKLSHDFRKPSKSMNILNKLWNNRQLLHSIIPTIYFNFHYLPFSQALRLPILLYKPKLLKLKGNIKLGGGACEEGGKVRFGMVRLGFPVVSLYPSSGIMYESHSGTVIFHGTCSIGNNSAISVGAKATVEFGDCFSATTTLRLTSYDSVTFGDRVSLGWDILVMDTDFHKLTKLSGGYSRGHAPVRIGSDNWFGNGCTVMKRTTTPDYCVISAGTVLSGPVNAPEYSVVGSKNEIVVKATGVWWNCEDDKIEY